MYSAIVGLSRDYQVEYITPLHVRSNSSSFCPLFIAEHVGARKLIWVPISATTYVHIYIHMYVRMWYHALGIPLVILQFLVSNVICHDNFLTYDVYVLKG